MIREDKIKVASPESVLLHIKSPWQTLPIYKQLCQTYPNVLKYWDT